MSARKVIHEGLGFGEGPRWRDGRLWYSDFYRRAVFTLDVEGVERKVVDVPAQPSGLGWLPDGRLIVSSMTDRKVLRLEPDGSLVQHADLSDSAGFHVNDLIEGHTGAGRDVADAAHRVRCRRGRQPVQPSGLCIHRKAMAAPDGICADPEGGIWVATALTPTVLRFAEGGEVTGSVETSQIAYACAMGGENRRTLFAMTAPRASRPWSTVSCTVGSRRLRSERIPRSIGWRL